MRGMIQSLRPGLRVLLFLISTSMATCILERSSEAYDYLDALVIQYGQYQANGNPADPLYRLSTATGRYLELDTREKNLLIQQQRATDYLARVERNWNKSEAKKIRHKDSKPK